MDSLDVLTHATGRGWKTSEFLVSCAAIVAILLVAPSAGQAVAVAIVTGAYTVARAVLKSATSRALLAPVEPPMSIVERPVRPLR